MKNLDQKQKLFCEYYVEGKSPKQAALDAGYAKSLVTSSPYKWIKDAKFIEYIEYLKNFEGYPIENYVRDLNKCMDLAQKGEITKSNALLRIVRAKGAIFGYNLSEQHYVRS